MDNSFKTYTDKLAATLEQKNQAYGDSFTKSVDEDGLLVLKIRLGDKFNRISELIKNAKDDMSRSWLSVGLTVIDLTLIVLLFIRGI